MFWIGNQSLAIDCTLGGSAMPTARKARLAADPGAGRSMTDLRQCPSASN
jgi:hypothetical protein